VFHVERSSTSKELLQDAKFDVGQFSELLAHWSRTINLIGRDDVRLLGERHIADSLQLAPLIPAHIRRAIDLGSGAGFPGLVLAMQTGISFDLIEADHRKAAFLREAARRLDAPVCVYPMRIERVRLDPADLVTARALAPLQLLLRLAAPMLTPAGIGLFPKGVEAEAELTGAASEWHMEAERVPSRTASGATILRISHLHRAPSPS
jgi:16S rRNA (guanine527-N7)-methyltransferase